MSRKELTDMTLEELWQLFPIVLADHDDRWAEFFRQMRDTLAEILAPFPPARVSHIGSTAVPGIKAKPIVDVLVELPAVGNLETAAQLLEQNGFIRMSQSEGRISLNFGYTPDGYAQKVYHIHLRHLGDCDELYFRDLLIACPDIAAEYEVLKLSLWKRYEHDRDAYTAAKGDFVREWTTEAKTQYAGRYERPE